tara:strand:- start:12373 stop:13326 length:954 start_codon:yes stop_codon:yes gene_type:complete
MEYLDFELPLKDLNEQLENCKKLGNEGKIDVKDTLKEIKLKIQLKKKEIYSSINAWQRVQLSRHPSRPYTLDYLNNMTDGRFLELHGDRNISDDKAMIGGLGKLDNQTFMFIGQQKGNNIKSRQYRNFGMANPEGYRKALRLMKLAEKFSLPIVTLIDTPGAYPGIEAEEKGQAEAIARNLYEMFKIRTQIIVVVIGEGASGGALGIGVGDKIMMLENTWYSVISPESCSSILWRSWDHKEQAAEALKLTPHDMKKNKLIDKIIKEPLGGAHQNPQKIYATLKKEVINTFLNLKKQSISKLLENRMSRFTDMGIYKD